METKAKYTSCFFLLPSQNAFGLVREEKDDNYLDINIVELHDIDTFKIKQTLSIPQLSHECPTYDLCDQTDDRTFYLNDVVYNATYNKLIFAKNKYQKPCNSLGICTLNTAKENPIQEVQKLKGHNHHITAINTLDTLTVSASTDRYIKLWDLEKAVCTRTIRAGINLTKYAYELLPLNNTTFLCATVSDDWSKYYHIMKYDTRTEDAVDVWECDEINRLALGFDEHTFLTGGNFIKVWDQRLRTNKLELIDNDLRPTHDLTHYKHFVLALKGGYIWVWDTTTKERDINGNIDTIGHIQQNSTQHWKRIKPITQDTLLIIGKEYPEKWNMAKYLHKYF